MKQLQSDVFDVDDEATVDRDTELVVILDGPDNHGVIVRDEENENWVLLLWTHNDNPNVPRLWEDEDRSVLRRCFLVKEEALAWAEDYAKGIPK